MKNATALLWMVALLATGLASESFATVQNESLKVLASDPEPTLNFGNAVAIDGTTAVVGAYRDSDNGVNSGSVYVLNATTGAEIVKLLPNDGAADDWFGYSVGIDGNTVVVGARYKSDNGTNSGAAYLFNATTGAQIAKLAPSDNLANDQFGFAVAISGNIAVVSALADDDPNSPLGMDAGSVYVFDATTGTEFAKIFPTDGAWFDYFGQSVALDDNIAIIGATGGVTSIGGAAYLFDLATPGAPVQIAKLEPSDAAAGDNFGFSVGVDGGMAVVSSPHDDDNGWNSGSAYLFDTSSYAQLAKLTADDGAVEDYFGKSVAIVASSSVVSTGYSVVISASQDDDYGIASGAAYFFDAETNLQVNKLLASDGEGGDQFGFSAAIGDGIAVVGAPLVGDNVSGNHGAVYFFDSPSAAPVVPSVPWIGLFALALSLWAAAFWVLGNRPFGLGFRER